MLYFSLPRPEAAGTNSFYRDAERSATWIARVLLLLRVNTSYSSTADSSLMHIHRWLSSGAKQKLHMNLPVIFLIFSQKEWLRRLNWRAGAGLLFRALQEGDEQNQSSWICEEWRQRGASIQPGTAAGQNWAGTSGGIQNSSPIRRQGA